MNKVILIFAAIAVVSIGGVPMAKREVDESDRISDEIVPFLRSFCATLVNDDSEGEDQDNEIGGWDYDEGGDNYRKKRDLSEHGFDADVLATQDGVTLMGSGLALACVGLFKHDLEQSLDLVNWFESDDEDKRRKRRFVKRSVNLTSAKKNN